MKEIGSFNPFRDDAKDLMTGKIPLQLISSGELAQRILFLRQQIDKNAWAADLGSLSRESLASNTQDAYLVEYLGLLCELMVRTRG